MSVSDYRESYQTYRTYKTYRSYLYDPHQSLAYGGAWQGMPTQRCPFRITPCNPRK